MYSVPGCNLDPFDQHILIVRLWFRDGWARLHTHLPRPRLQSHEERVWRRFCISNHRLKSEMDHRLRRAG